MCIYERLFHSPTAGRLLFHIHQARLLTIIQHVLCTIFVAQIDTIGAYDMVSLSFCPRHSLTICLCFRSSTVATDYITHYYVKPRRQDKLAAQAERQICTSCRSLHSASLPITPLLWCSCSRKSPSRIHPPSLYQSLIRSLQLFRYQ